MLLGHIFLRRCVQGEAAASFVSLCLPLNISNLFWRSLFNKEIGLEEIAGTNELCLSTILLKCKSKI
jgi:hypothetical protein